MSPPGKFSLSRKQGKETHKFLEFVLVLDLDRWLAGFVDELEWPVLLIPLDLGIVEVSANQTYSSCHKID